MRLVDSSRGRIGVAFSFTGASVLPWFDGRWVTPAERISFAPRLRELIEALSTAGLPQAEAEEFARAVLDEREAKLAESRSRLRAPIANPPLQHLALPLLVLALWTVGAGYWSLRALRALREVA
jgi:hypothetical protein